MTVNPLCWLSENWKSRILTLDRQIHCLNQGQHLYSNRKDISKEYLSVLKTQKRELRELLTEYANENVG